MLEEDCLGSVMLSLEAPSLALQMSLGTLSTLA